MSFYTEKLISHFPRYFKMAKDKSSNGYRTYSIFSDVIENIYYENIILKKFLTFFNEIKQIGELFAIDLEQKDRIEASNLFILPLVIIENKFYKFVDNFSEFLNQIPTSFEEFEEKEINEWLVWDSRYPETYIDIKEDEHLLIDLTTIDKFLTGGRVDQKNFQFFYNYVVNIKGYDELYNEIEERVFVLEKKQYITKKTFKEITSIDWDGFVGDFKIYVTEKKNSNKKYLLEEKYCTFEKEKRNIKVDLHRENNKSFFRYIRADIRNGIAYSRSVEPDEDAETFLLDQALLDSNNAYIDAIDYCIDPNSRVFYVLDSQNKVYAYKPRLQDFKNSREKATSSNLLIFEDIENVVGFEEEVTYSLMFKSYTAGIESYQIYRYAPDGTKEYYQINDTWSSSPNTFSVDTNLLYKQRKTIIHFDNYFDQLGQWEFYVKVKYEEFDENETSSIMVMCESLKPEKEWKFKKKENSFYDGIFFDKKRKFSLSLGRKYFSFKEKYETFSYSPVLYQVVFRNQEDDVEIIVPTIISFYKKNNKYYFKLNESETDSIVLKRNERHCFVQKNKINNDKTLFFSTYSTRDEALLNKEEAVYYIDYTEVTRETYKNRLNTGDYDIIHIVVEGTKELYCFCEEDSNLSFKINLTDKEIFNRLNDNYGYL